MQKISDALLSQIKNASIEAFFCFNFLSPYYFLRNNLRACLRMSFKSVSLKPTCTF
jgi:hypothetical protein